MLANAPRILFPFHTDRTVPAENDPRSAVQGSGGNHMAEKNTKPTEVSQLSAALDETSLEQARERFDAARAKVITLAPRERHGIGMQSEKTLHAVLKNYIDSDEDHQEIPVDRYIADIFSGDHIIEIQTANMNAMRAKLACFLPQYPVRVVYPIPAK